MLALTGSFPLMPVQQEDVEVLDRIMIRECRRSE